MAPPLRAVSSARSCDGQISASLEKCLRTIYELTEEGAPTLRARVAERLAVTGSSTGETVARLEDRGLVRVDVYRTLRLTPAGELTASRVLRRHRLAECFLATVAGLRLDQVHAEASRWQHVLSSDVERRFLELLGRPRESPFGNPIPGLGELGVTDEPRPFLHGVERLSDALGPSTTAVPVRIRRIGEFAQEDTHLVAALDHAGILGGGGTADARSRPGGVLLTRERHRIGVTATMAKHLYVVA